MSIPRITEILEKSATPLFKNVTGAAAIATTLAPAARFRLKEVRIHLDAAGGAGNFTANLNSNAGVEYDTNLITQDMTAVVDFVWTPDFPLQFDAGDEIDFAWANAGTKTYGLTIIYELI